MQKKQFPSVLASWAKQSEELVYRKMMKANDGLLVEKWNEFYKHLIIEDRVFDVNSKELILLSLLTNSKEANGRIHIKRALEVGISEKQVIASINLAGVFASFQFYEFTSKNWSEEIPIDHVLNAYVNNIETYSKILSPKLIEIMGTVCHAARRSVSGMQFHLIRAFDLGAKKEEIAESLTYLIMLCSIPTLNDAVKNWIQVADQGKCPYPYPK